MDVATRIRNYERDAMCKVLNGPDPDRDIDCMFIPHEYSKALYHTIVNDMMVHLSAHALSGSTAMDVFAQWTEMYEGKVIDRGPNAPDEDPRHTNYDF